MKKYILCIAMMGLGLKGFSQDINKGKTVYTKTCIACHQATGAGIPGAFPPLAKTGHLTDKNKLVKIILQGMRGPITVKGVKYDVEMASVGLTDKETADVINYIRNSWGNKAPMVTVAEVAAAKKR